MSGEECFSSALRAPISRKLRHLLASLEKIWEI
jgi:hypothetical protein